MGENYRLEKRHGVWKRWENNHHDNSMWIGNLGIKNLITLTMGGPWSGTGITTSIYHGMVVGVGIKTVDMDLYE